MSIVRATLGLFLACLGAVVYAFMDRNNQHGEGDDE
jgi:hypothetical protein